MAIWAIGDVQGCFDALQALLERIRFDPARDRLWFTGDLVNRGPQSLETLRFVKDLGERAVTVLGNHDLHLLAAAHGHARHSKHDTFDDVLTALDRDELLDWLRHRPLLHHDAELGWTLVHAGLLPQWNLADAQRLAVEAEAVLRGPGMTEFFAHMYGDIPDHWRDDLHGHERTRVIVNAFTRLRFCDREGAMDLRFKCAPWEQPPALESEALSGTAAGAPVPHGSEPAARRPLPKELRLGNRAPPPDLVPWFQAPHRRSGDARIVFGHWSTLGPYDGDNVLALDGGCLWGRSLCAARLLPGSAEIFSVRCGAGCAPRAA